MTFLNKKDISKYQSELSNLSEIKKPNYALYVLLYNKIKKINDTNNEKICVYFSNKKNASSIQIMEMSLQDSTKLFSEIKKHISNTQKAHIKESLINPGSYVIEVIFNNKTKNKNEFFKQKNQRKNKLIIAIKTILSPVTTTTMLIASASLLLITTSLPQALTIGITISALLTATTTINLLKLIVKFFTKPTKNLSTIKKVNNQIKNALKQENKDIYIINQNNLSTTKIEQSAINSKEFLTNYIQKLQKKITPDSIKAITTTLHIRGQLNFEIQIKNIVNTIIQHCLSQDESFAKEIIKKIKINKSISKKDLKIIAKNTIHTIQQDLQQKKIEQEYSATIHTAIILLCSLIEADIDDKKINENIIQQNKHIQDNINSFIEKKDKIAKEYINSLNITQNEQKQIHDIVSSEHFLKKALSKIIENNDEQTEEQITKKIKKIIAKKLPNNQTNQQPESQEDVAEIDNTVLTNSSSVKIINENKKIALA